MKFVFSLASSLASLMLLVCLCTTSATAKDFGSTGTTGFADKGAVHVVIPSPAFAEMVNYSVDDQSAFSNSSGANTNGNTVGSFLLLPNQTMSVAGSMLLQTDQGSGAVFARISTAAASSKNCATTGAMGANNCANAGANYMVMYDSSGGYYDGNMCVNLNSNTSGMTHSGGGLFFSNVSIPGGMFSPHDVSANLSTTGADTGDYDYGFNFQGSAT